MDSMEKVKAECDRNLRCKTCKLVKSNGRCSLPDTPSEWDIEAIRKALGEEQKEEIVVPEKWIYTTKICSTQLAEKQNEIIDCIRILAEEIK